MSDNLVRNLNMVNDILQNEQSRDLESLIYIKKISSKIRIKSLK